MIACEKRLTYEKENHDFVDSSMRSVDWAEEREVRKQIRAIQSQANRIGEIEVVKEKEKEFLKEHKNSTFCEFVDANLPYFVRYKMAKDYSVSPEKVYPKTPRALELCVHKLEHDALLEEADRIEWFIDKCECVRDESIYQTEEWDSTIAGLTQFVSHYAEMERKYAKESGIDAEEDEM